MRIALLGPMEVWGDDGSAVEIAGRRLRALLARLVLAPGRVVSATALVDAVWGGAPPEGAANALQSLASRLRRALPAPDAQCLEYVAVGYRLRIPEDRLDVYTFEGLAAAGRRARDTGDLVAAARQFASALQVWRGEPLADLASTDFGAAAAARLRELRLSTIEDRLEVQLGLGESAEAVAELEGLTSAHPLRERLRGLQMRALCAAGRPAEALSTFETLRRALAEQLGADPSPDLRTLHTAILRDDERVLTVRAGPTPQHNLPTPRTSLIGRDHEVERVDRLLNGGRLVTLVGPGGVGKSRLATATAARRLKSRAEAVWLVDLVSLREASEVASSIVATLRPLAHPNRAGESLPVDADARPFAPGTGSLDALLEDLRDRSVLIVLDHCEHLVEACAQAADAILAGCPRVRILAASRQPLGVDGEVLYPVEPLTVPPRTANRSAALGFPALRLFAERAAAARPGFLVGEDNVGEVVEVCQRLDGLPLAIELACARLRAMPIGEVAARLDDRFRLLVGGNRAAPARHRTLLAAVRWSWDLLSEPERTLARRLSVFVGGATPEAAETVCAGRGLASGDVVGLLSELVDKSLVQWSDVPARPPRYRMLETIGAFAASALADAGEADVLARAHAAYFLRLAETAEPALRGPEQVGWLSRLDAEYANLTGALRWALDAGQAGVAIRLTAALGCFWMLRGEHAEAASWLRAALKPGVEVIDAVPSSTLAAAHAYDAMHHYAVQDAARATDAVAAALGWPAEDPATPHAMALLRMSVAVQEEGTAAAGLAWLERHGHRDPWLRAAADLWLGHFAEHVGDVPGAVRHFTAAVQRFTAVRDAWGVTSALHNLGSTRSLSGEPAAAIAAFDESLRFSERIGAWGEVQSLRVQRGMARLRAGDSAGALADLSEGPTGEAGRRPPPVSVSADTGLADIARRAGDLPRAWALLQGALRQSEADGVPLTLRVQVLTGLGRVSVAAGDLDDAHLHLVRALRVGVAVGAHPLLAGVGEAMAALALARGAPTEAARLLGLSAAARGAADRGNPDVRATEATARATLGGDFEPAYLPAAALSPSVAVARLAEVGDAPGTRVGEVR